MGREIEVAIPPALVSIKLIYPAANPFSVFDLAALTAKSENIKKTFQRQRRLGLPGCLAGKNLTYTIALKSTYHMLFARLQGECPPILPTAG